MAITGLKVQKVLQLALPNPSPVEIEAKPLWGQRPIVTKSAS